MKLRSWSLSILKIVGVVIGLTIWLSLIGGCDARRRYSKFKAEWPILELTQRQSEMTGFTGVVLFSNGRIEKYHGGGIQTSNLSKTSVNRLMLQLGELGAMEMDSSALLRELIKSELAVLRTEKAKGQSPTATRLPLYSHGCIIRLVVRNNEKTNSVEWKSLDCSIAEQTTSGDLQRFRYCISLVKNTLGLSN